MNNPDPDPTTMTTPNYCLSCCEGGECLFDKIWPDLKLWLADLDTGIGNNIKRKKAYREAIFEEFGYLGRNNRKPVPLCTRQKIRDAFPENNGEYMGHRDV